MRIAHRKRKNASEKSFLAMVMISLILFSTVASVSAEKTEAFLQGYRAEEGKVLVYCSSLSGIDGMPEQGEISANVGDQDIPVADISTVEEQGEGITYYCLVDVSKSMHEEQFDQAKAVLNTICDGLGEEDNMVVGALGTELTSTTFLRDKKKIHAAIDRLAAEDDYTALYDAIQTSLSALMNSNKSCQKKCLIIISDGEDDTVIGTTREEAQNAVKDSKIPVYTVAALRESYTDEQISHAEGLGAFARISTGGEDYVPLLEGTTAADAGTAILEDSRAGVILTLDTSKLKAEHDEMTLLVQFKNDVITCSDSLHLYAADLLYEAETETEAITETELTTETESETETEAATETESETETEAATETETITEAELTTETELATETESAAVTEAVTEAESAAVTETEPSAETEAVTESGLGSEIESELNGQTGEETEAEAESETERVTAAEEKTSFKDDTMDDSFHLYQIVLLILAIVAVAAAVLYAIRSRNRNDEQSEEESENMDPNGNDGFERVVVREIKPGTNDRARSKDTPAKPEAGAVIQGEGEAGAEIEGRKYHVRFAAIGYGDTVFELVLPEEKTVTVGRGREADYILNKDDKYLSSVNCRLCCMQGAISIWDLSKNGTFVNGVPIRQIGMATIQSGDSVRMGGYEYRVTITVEEANTDGN